MSKRGAKRMKTGAAEVERRTEVLPPVRVTPDERDVYMDKAEEGGETFSAFVRRAMDECRPLPVVDLPEPVRRRRAS